MLNIQSNTLLLVDAHVHIYDCFSVERLLDSAFHNFSRVAAQNNALDNFEALLLLTETSKHSWFESVVQSEETRHYGGWHVQPANSGGAVLIAENQDRHRILIAAGRQIITQEGIEVLSLLNRNTIADGKPIEQVLNILNKQGVLTVLPWAVGKWLGNRGQMIREIAQNSSMPTLRLGDNGGRPIFWPKPALLATALQQGRSVISGSDPLPVPGQESRVGSFGFGFRPDEPIESEDQLKNAILNAGTRALVFGALENPLRFLINQITIRLQKRH